MRPSSAVDWSEFHVWNYLISDIQKSQHKRDHRMGVQTHTDLTCSQCMLSRLPQKDRKLQVRNLDVLIFHPFIFINFMDIISCILSCNLRTCIHLSVHQSSSKRIYTHSGNLLSCTLCNLKQNYFHLFKRLKTHFTQRITISINKIYNLCR